MKLGYDHNINNSCITLEVDASEQIVQYEWRMLCENTISHLIKPERKMQNNNIVFNYCINNYISLDQKSKRGELEGNDVYLIIDSLVKLGKALDDFLLTENHLVLWPSAIFYKENIGCVDFIYYPCNVGNIEESLIALSEFIIGHVDHSEPDAIALAYKFYDMVNNKDFAFDTILEQYRLSLSICNQGIVENENIEKKDEVDNIYEYKETNSGFLKRNRIFSIIILASVLCIIAILGKIY